MNNIKFTDHYSITDENEPIIQLRQIASFIVEQDNKNMQDALINSMFITANKYKVDINEEQFLKWIEQSRQIEKSTAKEIKDIKAKYVIQQYKEKLKERDKEISRLKKKLEKIQETIGD